ncbi:MAG: hypothetical protein ACUVX8_17780 [Candidatus Zipacnadales bacterium]
MLRAVALVLGVLILCVYLAFFLSLNMETYNFRVFRTSGSYFEQPLPVGSLLVIGIVLGAVAMALALWAPWNALKTSAAQQRALVQKAKQRLKSQDEKIKSLTKQLEEAKAASAEVEEGATELDTATKAAVAELASVEVDSPPSQTGSAEEDSEVI